MIPLAASVSYAVCLLAPVLYFAGAFGADAYRTLLAIGSAGWLLFATMWVARRSR